MQIVTDSSAEISREEAEALGVEVVPLTVVFGSDSYADGVDLSKEEFYARLLAGEFPHTSQPNEEQFTQAFARTEGEETLVLLISSALSGSMNAARLAKEEGGFTNVHLFETFATTAVLRILVETAVKHREKPVGEVISILEELRPRIKLLACLDTLEYLRKGGRIKRSTALVGGLLGVKPLVTIGQDGTVEVVGRAHGQKKALLAIAESFLKDKVDEEYPVYFLQTDNAAPPQEIMKAVKREKSRIFPICCAVGTHIGPNAAGITYVTK